MAGGSKPGSDVKIVEVRPTGQGMHVDVKVRAEHTSKGGTTVFAEHTHGTDGVRGETRVGVSIPLGRDGKK